MLDSSGSENGGVCENIQEFFEFYNGRRISWFQKYCWSEVFYGVILYRVVSKHLLTCQAVSTT